MSSASLCSSGDKLMGRDLQALCTAGKIQNFNGTSPCMSTMGKDASTCPSAMARLEASSCVTPATAEAATPSETFCGEKTASSPVGCCSEGVYENQVQL